jgi:ELWxxDGT repeat protein
VADIYPGSIASNPTDFIVYNNALYFAANSPSASLELMKYDGTSVSLVSDLNPGGNASSFPRDPVVFNGELFFGARDGTAAGYELFRYDGTGVYLAADINPSGDSFPRDMIVFNNQLYFMADDGGTYGTEFFRLSVVPEPSGGFLCAIGCCALAAGAGKRKRRDII